MQRYKKRLLLPGEKPRARTQRPEQAGQIYTFSVLRQLMQAQGYGEFIAYHVPNGGYRTPAEANRFKDMGVMPGVADIQVLLPGKHGNAPKVLFIEFKAIATPKPTRYRKCDGQPYKARAKSNATGQSKGQGVFQKIVESYGFNYYLVQGADSASFADGMLAILRYYGVVC